MEHIFIVTGFIFLYTILILTGILFIGGVVAMGIYSRHNHPAITTMRFYDNVYRKLDKYNKINIIEEIQPIIKKYYNKTK